MKRKTFRIAFSSLLVSALSVFIAVLGFTLRGGTSFQILGYPQILALIISAVFFAVIYYLTVQWFEQTEQSKTERMTDPNDKRQFYSHMSRLFSSSINILIAIVFGWAAFIGLALNTINRPNFDVATLPLISFLALVIIAIAGFSYFRVLHFGRLIYQLEVDLNIVKYAESFKTFPWMLELVRRRNAKAWSPAEIIVAVTLGLYFIISTALLILLL